MVELMSIAFSPLNIVFTVLLIVIVLYWITVIIGVLDVDLFDIDFDADMDFDADVDVDVDLDGAPEGARAVMEFFYIGEIPIMVLVSLMILSMWALSVLGNYYFNPEGRIAHALGLGVVNFIISLGVVKLVAAPLRPFYALFNKDYNAPRKLMGRICRIMTTEVTPKHRGQAEVTTKGAPIIVNVSPKQAHSFTKDDQAIIVGKDKETGIYYIVPPNLEK
jgi:hypothetical protein